MRSKVIIIGLLGILLCATYTSTATPAHPLIRLPTDLVTMNAVYGNQSYFAMTLSDVPLGFDVINGVYLGWCLQKNINMTQHVNHTVYLYSCYDPSLPFDLYTSHWDEINYLLNHKQGTPESIQRAIWFFTNNEDCSADPNASAMVTAAQHHGNDFIPAPGQIIAVPVEGIPTIQLSFLELAIPYPHDIDGFIWQDRNKNGLQDKGEPGVQAIPVHLYQHTGLLLNITTSSTQGYYFFSDVTTGSYYIHIIAPSGSVFSPKNIGTDDTLDSDVDASGNTEIFTITIDANNPRYDAGLYTPTVESTPVPNHRPTADGTAGEPYKGFVNTQITFDGSRSYDRDGRIISWRWSFGDGNTDIGEIITHAYQHPGNYTVTLTVTDNDFETDTYTTAASIYKGNNPPDRPLVTGPATGRAAVSNNYSIIVTDPDADHLQITIDWDDGFTDTFRAVESGSETRTTHVWASFGFYTLRVTAEDTSNATSESFEMLILIDVDYVGDLGYLIDSDGDGIFDMFHTNNTAIDTQVILLENGDYLIDTDGDNLGDTQYNPLTRLYRAYHAPPILEYLLIILLVLVFIMLYLMLRIRRQTRTLSSNKKNNNK